MPARATDFYLNLDRWDALSSIERHRGCWEERLRGPDVRLDPVRTEAMIEAAWAVHAPGEPLDRSIHKTLAGSSPPPPNAPATLLRAWGYVRAVRFVQGWFTAFRWTHDEVVQLCRILGEPSIDTIERAAKGLLSLRDQAKQVSVELGGVPLVELAIFYGGIRRLQARDDTYIDPYLLGMRLLLLQKGYAQVSYSSIEANLLQEPDDPPTTTAAEDMEGRLGRWLDEMIQLLNAAGLRAEELWKRSLQAASRSNLQEAIMNIAQQNGKVTAGDVLRETGANRNTVKDNLVRLVKLGILKKRGTKRGTFYLPV
jgi:hypothetical protein